MTIQRARPVEHPMYLLPRDRSGSTFRSPNPPCTSATTALPDIYAARSRHASGINVALGDGSIRFVKNSINIRVWGALSTTKGAEIVSADDF